MCVARDGVLVGSGHWSWPGGSRSRALMAPSRPIPPAFSSAAPPGADMIGSQAWSLAFLCPPWVITQPGVGQLRPSMCGAWALLAAAGLASPSHYAIVTPGLPPELAPAPAQVTPRPEKGWEERWACRALRAVWGPSSWFFTGVILGGKWGQQGPSLSSVPGRGKHPFCAF